MARTKDHPVRCDNGAAPGDVSQRDFKPSLVPLLVVPPGGDGGRFRGAFFRTGSFVLRHGWVVRWGWVSLLDYCFNRNVFVVVIFSYMATDSNLRF